MPISETDIAHLLLKKLTGKLTAEEAASLDVWRQTHPQKYAELTSPGSLAKKLQAFTEAQQRAEQLTPPEINDNVIPIHNKKRRWVWVAAAILLLAGTGAYLWTVTRKPEQAMAKNSEQPAKDIAPGGSKALLTLADGSTILLDNAAKGQLAMQGSTRIIKNEKDKVSYSQNNSKEVAGTNTLSTPKGGQYQLTLPDGTNVWINAASSITFPTAFTGKDRHVQITGEAYFEVAKNTHQPFFVDVEVDGNEKETIEVLGTKFNVNSYSNETSIATTLMEGNVKVTAGKRSLLLKPGQQTQLKQQDQSITINLHPDLEKIIAWKQGLFNFNDADVPSVMRQLERWYDIQVRYEGAVPALRLKGELDRGVPLSGILKILPELGIRYRLDNRTLIVSE